jgi:hypothetical protein
MDVFYVFIEKSPNTIPPNNEENRYKDDTNRVFFKHP